MEVRLLVNPVKNGGIDIGSVFNVDKLRSDTDRNGGSSLKQGGMYCEGIVAFKVLSAVADSQACNLCVKATCSI